MEKLKLLGINENNVLVFFSSWNTTFGGACGVTMNAQLTQDAVDEFNTIEHIKDNYDYLWREAVHDGNTELGLDAYCEELLDGVGYTDELYFGDDPSYRWEASRALSELDEETFEKVEAIIGKEDEDYVALDCESCGSLFSDMASIDTSKWKLIVNQKLIDEIAESLRKKEAGEVVTPESLK